MDDGEQRIEDDEERARLRKQARKVSLQSLALALVGTAIAWVI
jgi:hypothetical protein